MQTKFSMTVIGNVKGKDVIIVDDMCDTAGTLTKAAGLMMEYGANSVINLYSRRSKRRRL